MIFKKNAKIESDDFWYDLTDGGYIKPKKLLEEPYATQVANAVKLLRDFKREAEAQEILLEY